ncbi:MAG TPA: ABC transporter permease [bacterium]|nr:ABC transporter permease [bacterium]HMW34647.1 ABC transporter permease [bacterium]HMW36502.1 ABC transporter permease [bacterium]HMY35188.1 ABC transporter permease [bacterium]HMZ03924.1 ABC transporter permease [bacterium]
MGFSNIFKIAFNALMRNKMRSALTMLGIVIGVGSIIAMTGVGAGAQKEIDNQTAAFGTNMITIRSGGMTAGGIRIRAMKELQPSDGDAIVRGSELVTAQTPVIRLVTNVVSSERNWASQVYGVNTSFTTIRNWGMMHGAMFTDQDYRSGNKVCVLGSTVAVNLFGQSDPTGEIVRIQNIPFRVAGVLESKGQLASGQDQDDMIIIPYTTYDKRLTGDKNIDYIYVSVRTSQDMTTAMEEIRQILRQEHRIPAYGDDDFTIRTQEQVNEIAKSISKTVSLLMIIVASISLLVGGIGIMNIMLVSVTERTREIGIRMAIGATEKHILLQFLVEAVVLSLTGGVIGMILGVVIGYLVETFTSWAVSISMVSVVVSMSFAAGVGIFFGFYPARKAASLNPIEALRFE